MSVTPKDFLDSADILSKSGNDEMTQRNVLSRAYYAAYHRSCEFIKPEDSDENVGVHKRYINQLMRGENGSKERKIGGRIKSMYLRRRSADYLLKDTIKNDATGLQVGTAKELFLLIDAFEKENSGDTESLPPSPPHRPNLKIIK